MSINFNEGGRFLHFSWNSVMFYLAVRLPGAWFRFCRRNGEVFDCGIQTDGGAVLGRMYDPLEGRWR